MSFMDAYKSLEKLCGEIYDDQHGVSLYIDEMLHTPDGSFYVAGWKEDLKQLKHYRWVRNQIVHEPGCTEANMCSPKDTRWLLQFHSRIRKANDPLAQYQKAKKQKKQKKAPAARAGAPAGAHRNGAPHRSAGCLMYLAGAVLATALLLWIFTMVY